MNSGKPDTSFFTFPARAAAAALATAAALALTLAVACLAAAGCKAETQAPPATPEELAAKVFGQARPGTLEPGVYETAVDASGELTVKLRLGIVTSDSLRRCEERLVAFFSDVFRYQNVTSVYVQIDFPFRDGKGNVSLEKGLTVRLRRTTAGGIDWKTFDPAALPRTADSWWVDVRVGG